MKPALLDGTWHVRVIGSRLPWGSRPDRPADIGDELCAAMLARENVLEDANYQKIAPNRFVVEIGQENYAQNYQVLEDQILQQWGEKLLAYLLTANSRQGRQEYRFAGPVKLEILPVADLGMGQARIRSRVQTGKERKPAAGSPVDLATYLEVLPDGQRWALHAGIMTLGRSSGCDICLDASAIRETKLVSNLHAYLQCQGESYHLFDGAPDGKPSRNGTYVNLRRLPPGGVDLKDGDLILLAALDPDHPDVHSPGVASLRFHKESR